MHISIAILPCAPFPCHTMSHLGDNVLLACHGVDSFPERRIKEVMLTLVADVDTHSYIVLLTF